MPDDRVITVFLDDGNTIDYKLRGLSEDEIPVWAEFCASVFSYKEHPPPPSYFERHYTKDPRRDASLVRVACTNTGQIISSCRVFPRTISAAGTNNINNNNNGNEPTMTTLEAGGIGEVCTDTNHRRRGLSKALLMDAMNIMTERGIPTSLLHSAPTYFPVYSGVGYTCTNTQWSVISVDRKRLESSNNNVRLAEFPTDTARLMKVHQEYSEKRFLGTIIRSEQYWNEYLANDLEGTIYVVVDEKDVIAGWVSLRPRGDRSQIRDFGCDRTLMDTSQVLSVLLYTAMASVDTDVVELQLPSVILNEVQASASQSSYVNWSTVIREDDLGWMYKTLQDGVADIPEAIDEQHPHLIWPADTF
jgi:predicted GNAT family N-acyltransferase